MGVDIETITPGDGGNLLLCYNRLNTDEFTARAVRF